MNQENLKNAEIIIEVLNQGFKDTDKSQVKILDICCGVFDQSGVNYDQNGQIYEPLVAQKLAEEGYDVTGVDFRENNLIADEEILRFAQDDTPSVIDGLNINLKYTHRSDINILQENWQEKLAVDWNVLIFLRSWDTPEILLHYQETLDINDLNLLSLEIAKIYLPIFADLLKDGGLFFTTDICNYGVCGDGFEIQLYQNQVKQLIKKNGFGYLDKLDGLSWFRKLG